MSDAPTPDAPTPDARRPDVDVLSTAPPTLDVRPIPAFGDNYVWWFRLPDGAAVVVDPGDAAPVVATLEREGAPLGHILLTHHHADHVAGTDALRERFGAEVIGSALDAHRLPRLDRAVTDDAPFELGGHEVRVLAVPGHTRGHIAYVVEDAAFVGDTLFSYGCGRLFEGTPAEMWESLVAIRDLPERTWAYCGHEYTASNLRFARHLEPDNAALAAVADEVETLREAGRPTLPCLIEREGELNPFLRCDDVDFVKKLGMLDRSPAEVLGAIRARKDAF